MLLSVREDFPQPRKELDPGLLGQRCGNVAELNEGTEQCPSLWAKEDMVLGEAGTYAACIPTPKDTKAMAEAAPPTEGL